MSLLGVCVLDCAAGAEEDAEFEESNEFPLVDGLVVDELPGLLAGAFELLLMSELVPLDGLVLLPAAVAPPGVEELLLGVAALDWFIAVASLEPLGVVAAEEGELVFPADPLLLLAVQ